MKRQKMRAMVATVVVPALIGAVVGTVPVIINNNSTSKENLTAARREAWAAYLGTIDELDRIQPALTQREAQPDPDSNNVARWELAYPESKRQAAAVRILYGGEVSQRIKKLQDKELSVVDKWVVSGEWDDRAEGRDTLDTTDDLNWLIEFAENSVGD